MSTQSNFWSGITKDEVDMLVDFYRQYERKDADDAIQREYARKSYGRRRRHSDKELFAKCHSPAERS